MPNTMTLISSSTVGAGGASSISFSSIPQTYTDLQLVLSLRYSSSDTSSVNVSFNGSTSNYSGFALRGGGGSTNTISFTISSSNIGGNSTGSSGSSQTANTWANSMLYISNYTSSSYKPISTDFAQEASNANAFMGFYGSLWSDSSAINSITITPDSSTTWVQHSTAYLYGISNS